ncbi:hypothetical protein G9A89_018847 [Geosiphon pyriformis]|nr:hypothetical protein G9A89_018847 [Geosiphon pyriformis]
MSTDSIILQLSKTNPQSTKNQGSSPQQLYHTIKHPKIEFIIKQNDHEAVTTYLGRFNQVLRQILAIEQNYYTTIQVLNQFIKELKSSLLRSVQPHHLANLQETVTLTCDFELAEQEANYTQAVNLTINRTSDINAKITQLKKITTTANTHSNKIISNSNNFGDLISTTVTTAKNQDTLKPIPATKILVKHSIPIFHISKSTTPVCITSPVHSTTTLELLSTITNNTKIEEFQQQSDTNQQYPNQAFYFNFTEDQSFDKSTSMEEKDVKQTSKPSKQTKSNIPPVIITKNTTLAMIFSFDINNLNTYSLFSRAAINENKPIMALYTNARVRGIDIKLILNSGSASSIITKQLMDQLDCRIDHATTAQIITANGNTKIPIGEIDNFSFEINGIQIPIKVFIMKTTQYQTLVENDWLSKANATLDWNTQKLQLMFNKQYVSWADDYRTELLPPLTWEKKGKDKAEKEPQSLSIGYITLDQRNLFYQPLRLICVDCRKKLSTMDACIGDNKEWPTATKYYCRPCLLERFG